jgi:hypothetical protein
MFDRLQKEPEKVSADLGLCKTDYPLALIQKWITSAFATLAMENYPYAIALFPAWPSW